MIASKLNYLIERTIIVFVCGWGNWALYYWLMVLIFDASLTTLKLFSFFLLLQICISLVFFLRIDFGFASSYSSFCYSKKWFSIGVPDRRFYFISLTAMALAIAICLRCGSLRVEFVFAALQSPLGCASADFSFLYFLL